MYGPTCTCLRTVSVGQLQNHNDPHPSHKGEGKRNGTRPSGEGKD